MFLAIFGTTAQMIVTTTEAGFVFNLFVSLVIVAMYQEWKLVTAVFVINCIAVATFLKSYITIEEALFPQIFIFMTIIFIYLTTFAVHAEKTRLLSLSREKELFASKNETEKIITSTKYQLTI